MHFPRVFGSELAPISSVHFPADVLHTLSQNASTYLCGNCFLTFVAGSGVDCASAGVSSISGTSPVSILSVLVGSIRFTGIGGIQTSSQFAKRNSRRPEGERELGSPDETVLVHFGEVASPCFRDIHVCQPSSLHPIDSNLGAESSCGSLGDVAGVVVGG